MPKVRYTNQFVITPIDKDYKGIGDGWVVAERVASYQTIEEIIESCKKLNITSQAEYIKKYKEDNRLPSNPSLMHNFSFKLLHK